MAMNKIAYSIISVDQDGRKLGRWTSVLLKGKNGHLCRVICAYCPCRSSGPSSTYALQVIGLSKNQIFVCPRIQFWIDLKDYITQCKDANEQVIIMGDWNSKYDDVVKWMKAVGLKDIIVDRHQGSPPPTCERSRDHPIDAIFGPDSLTCWRGGYLSIDFLESDHRGLWCDIPMEFLLGYNMQHPAHAGARRLKTTDPRITHKYTKELHKLLTQENIYERLNTLHQSMQTTILPTDLIHFEELDAFITNAMTIAEKGCRKLRTGIVPWSPLYQQACDRVTYWTLLCLELQGKRVNVRKIRSLRKKLRITRDINITIAEAESKLKTAISNRKKSKRYAQELQMEYRY